MYLLNAGYSSKMTIKATYFVYVRQEKKRFKEIKHKEKLKKKKILYKSMFDFKKQICLNCRRIKTGEMT